ncbi:hypothetical protein [Ornithinimicrobium avium]|uniref:hypothetical protein n=1 Tax=Ornithinimicrobium avium TaxID=2283195 RepID=UPI0013B4163E|nr:hypothetical protein [Ornithinimicrobium avium]
MAAVILGGCDPGSGTTSGGDAPPSASDSQASDDPAPDAGPTPAEAGPTSSELIAAAVASGELDEPTSLLHRVQAQFGDPALPDDLRGAPEPHDLGLFRQLRDTLEELPAEVAAQIQPFLLRPTDPASAFSVGGNAVASHRTVSAAYLGADTSSEDGRRCADGWTWEAAGSTPFRVWACKDQGAGPADTAIQTVSRIVQEHAPDMMLPAPAGLGEPIPDQPGADPAQRADTDIDIYILPTGWLAPARDCPLVGACTPKRIDSPLTGGITLQSRGYDFDGEFGPDPRPASGTSAYILLNASWLEDPTAAERDVVHELFHSLQYAHHANVADRWFDEASAVWSEIFYVPERSAAVHEEWLSDLQDSAVSLVAEVPGTQRYAAYLWPLFMHQERGAEWIFTTWTALESSGDEPGAVISAIDDVTSVSAIFSDFVVRMLNADLPGDPITPRFESLDPHFPDGSTPGMPTVVLEPGQFASVLGDDPIPGLGYRYLRVSLPGSEDEDVAVEITGDLARADGEQPSVAALVRTERADHRYHRQSVDLDRTSLCASGELLLAISNTSLDAADSTSGQLTVERAKEPRCDGLAGDVTISLTGDYHSPPDQIPVPDRAQAHLRGVLHVAVGKPVPGELSTSPDYHPNAGSRWTMVGEHEYEACVGPSADPCIGARTTTQELSADVEIDADSVGVGTGEDGGWTVTSSDYVRIDLTADGPVLRAEIPIERRTTVRRPDIPDETSTDTVMWSVSCPVEGRFWLGGPGDRFAMPGGTGGLPGRWTDDRSELTFDCKSTWQPRTYDSDVGETGQVTVLVSGTLRPADVSPGS